MTKIKQSFFILIVPLILIGANIFFVGSFSLAKLLTKETGIALIMFFRFLAGPIYLIPYSLIKRHPLKMRSWRLLSFRVFCGVSAMSCLFLAFKYGDIGKGTLIFELSIIWTVLIDAILFKKIPHKYSLAVIPIAFLGLVLILNPTTFGSVSAGDGFALLGSLFNAGVYLSLKRLRDQYDTVTVVFWTYLISSVVVMIPSVSHLRLLTEPSFKLLILMSSVGFIGQLLMTLGFKFDSAGVSSLFMISIIPLTTLSGILFFNEIYTGVTLLGMGLIFSALIVIAKYR